jgi:cation:H+ antiporter
MLPILIWIGVFILSIAVLVKSSDFFTEQAEKIGVALKMPPFIVGILIVSVGTSLPELVSSIIAVINNNPEIVAGNVMGSNIANILLVLAIAAIAGKKLVIHHPIQKDLPFLIGSAFLLAITCYDGLFTLPEAILSIVSIIIYFRYLYKRNKIEEKQIKLEVKEHVQKERIKLLSWLKLIASGFFIYLGAQFTIESVINISNFLNIGTEIIAVTAVAIGTSLPELAVSISAAKKNNPGIAIGNVLGSNIFNSLAVMGIPALISPLVVTQSIIAFTIPIMVISSILFYFITTQKEVNRWEGAFLLVFYIFFIGKLFGFF